VSAKQNNIEGANKVTKMLTQLHQIHLLQSHIITCDHEKYIRSTVTAARSSHTTKTLTFDITLTCNKYYSWYKLPANYNRHTLLVLLK